MHTNNHLTRIAAQMRDDLIHVEQTDRILPDGLHLTLCARNTAYRLTIGYEARVPSTEEIAACARAFGVPHSADPVSMEVRRTNPKTHRSYRLRCFQLRWHELDESIASTRPGAVADPA